MKQTRCFSPAPARAARALWFTAVMLASALTLRAATTYFSSGFEGAEGFTPGSPLAGSGGWSGQVASETTNGSAGSGGNGIMSGVLPGSGQQAYVGKTPLGGDFGWLDVWRPVTSSNAPGVRISVTLQIVDSSNSQRDDFHWEAYNTQGHLLCGLDFDNYNRVIWFRSGTDPNFLYETVPAFHFQRGTTYRLELKLDFAANLWSAALNGGTVLGATPMVEPRGVALDLGRVDAVWDATASVYGAGYPGDNYMAFDNLQVTSGSPAQPTLRLDSLSTGSPALVRLAGEEGFVFAIDGSTNVLSPANWIALGTNFVSGGSFTLSDPAAASLKSRAYRARWLP